MVVCAHNSSIPMSEAGGLRRVQGYQVTLQSLDRPALAAEWNGVCFKNENLK